MVEKISSFHVLFADIEISSEIDWCFRMGFSKFTNSNCKFGKLLHKQIFLSKGWEVDSDVDAQNGSRRVEDDWKKGWRRNSVYGYARIILFFPQDHCSPISSRFNERKFRIIFVSRVEGKHIGTRKRSCNKFKVASMNLRLAEED